MLGLYLSNFQFARAMEATDRGPSATSSVARSRPEYHGSSGSSITWFSGVLILAYGLLLIGITSLHWSELQPPGSTLGPPSVVQTLTLRITEGIYMCIFGVVLSIGGFVLSRRDTRANDGGRWPPSQRWRSLSPYAAVALILIATFMNALPAPQRTVEFVASDFHLGTVPGDGPYENYFVSRPFSAFEGEAFFPGLSITWTDNRTGAMVERQNGATAYVTAPTAFPAPTESATGNLAPADGSYVAWVRYYLCETPATPPCSNYTASVTGSLVIATQLAYVRIQLALGAAGSALIALTLVQSARGNRRITK